MIEIVKGDITRLEVDAIVTAANSSLVGGGGVDGAIHRAAGRELLAASEKLAPCSPGGAVITPGFRLRAKWVIHAVGPVWHGGNRGEAETLRRTYESAFDVARREPSIRSIAFPAISTGVYAFPKPQAAAIALGEMRKRVPAFDRIVACVFDDEQLDLYRRLEGESDRR